MGESLANGLEIDSRAINRPSLAMFAIGS